MIVASTQLEKMAPKYDVILDSGAADDSFMEPLHNAGLEKISAHETEGCDLSGVQTIIKIVFRDFDYMNIPSNQFAAVTLLDVVEHVIDPKRLIRNCARILKINDLIYLHTPIVTRLDPLMHSFLKILTVKKAGAIWQRGRTSKFHLENCNSKSLTPLWESCGFVDIRFTVRNETHGQYKNISGLTCFGNMSRRSASRRLIYFFNLFLAANVFNANKAIVSAKKA